MRHSVQTVMNMHVQAAFALLGGAVGALCLYFNVHNVKDEWGLLAFVLAMVGGTLAVVTLASLAHVRGARQHRELAAHLAVMGLTLRTIGEANRRHAERLARNAMQQGDSALTILLRLDERTRNFTTAERAQVAEVIEQIAAVASILDDWRDRAAQNAPVVFEVHEVTLDTTAMAEPSALLDLAADTLRGLIEPQETGEAVTVPRDEPLRVEPA